MLSLEGKKGDGKIGQIEVVLTCWSSDEMLNNLLHMLEEINICILFFIRMLKPLNNG